MLAIVIPYYKLTFFEATLQSLASQTDKRFKVYVGDDASPEDPSVLLETYRGKFDFVYNRFDNNIGGVSLVKQWERCIAMTGDEEWIMILGDDDYLDKLVVASLYKNFYIFNTKTNVVRFASKIVLEEANTISDTYSHPIWEAATDSFFRKFGDFTRSSLSEYLFKRDSYNKYKFNDFPLAWYADDMAWLEFSDNNLIFSINEAIVFFRFSNSNISGKQDNLADKEYSKFLFYKKLVEDKLSHFNTTQKETLLLEFGIVAREQNQLHLKNSFYIAFQLAKNRSFYALAKFIRRAFKVKFK